MRRFFHCLFTLLGFACGVIIFTVGVVGFGCLYASYLIHPNSRWGNCWSFAVPRWIKYGGYLSMRVAEDVRFLKVFPVLHVLWCRESPRPGSMRMTRPVKRIEDKWFPVGTIYFTFKVSRMDAPHNAEPET